VGKTTALYQLVEDLIRMGRDPRSILLIRFDLQPLQEIGLVTLVRWFRERSGGAGSDAPRTLLLDEVHKLEGWSDQVKHVFDTFPLRLVLTGSSSVLVARGQRESLAGRAITTEFPPFLFREVLEGWHSDLIQKLPPALSLPDVMGSHVTALETFAAVRNQPPQRKPAWEKMLDRYYNRGGYPRLYSSEIEQIDDRWADYLVETVFDRVLGADIPDLFPVEQPKLLRHIYYELARRTGTEVSQGGVAEACNAAGFKTTQPVVGKYIHYLADALLIREFRRYPLARSRSARVPVKITLSDLGVRNAIYRGAPSLWESPPETVGPLVETLVQSVLRGPALNVSFYRDYVVPGNRRTSMEEVDFVAETLDGRVVPIEVKFRRSIRQSDAQPIRRFIERFKSPFGILVTREQYRCDRSDLVLQVPLLEFLLAF
jgi:hypothetical protein